MKTDGAAVKVIRHNPLADGQTQWIEVIGRPLLGPDGEILGVVESSRDITAHRNLTARLQERELQLEHLAQHDPLTGLPNRLLFADRLHQTMLHAHREHRKVALLFLDLDRFKSINDCSCYPSMPSRSARSNSIASKGGVRARVRSVA